ncbi:unnamed protein product [Lupinus luteus]|uniref:Uncharacterized protein n=1 Tax=Lupinus luteus TaxID=3873 RepID=A0AAV1XJY6_LUPLU
MRESEHVVPRPYTYQSSHAPYHKKVPISKAYSGCARRERAGTRGFGHVGKLRDSRSSSDAAQGVKGDTGVKVDAGSDISLEYVADPKDLEWLKSCMGGACGFGWIWGVEPLIDGALNSADFKEENGHVNTILCMESGDFCVDTAFNCIKEGDPTIHSVSNGSLELVDVGPTKVIDNVSKKVSVVLLEGNVGSDTVSNFDEVLLTVEKLREYGWAGF